jgi:hypothetical protein
MNEQDATHSALRAMAAVHEAGHAVVGVALGFEVIEVLLHGVGNQPAHTEFNETYEELFVESPDDAAVMVLAASCAEIRLIPNRRPTSFAGGDLPLIRQHHPAFQKSLPDAQILPLMRPLMDRAFKAVDAHRDAIETVTASLLEVDRLSGADLEALISHARVSATRLPTWVSRITD